jgi:hypothetical protein
VAGIGVLILLARAPETRPPAPPPGPLPAAEPPETEEDYEDLEEDAVMQVEEMLLDLSQQIRRRAFGGALFHVAEDFEGSPILREADGPSRVVGGVTLSTGGPDPRRLDRDAFRKALEQIVPQSLIFKLPSSRLEGDAMRARLKADASRVEAGRAKRWVSIGDAEFVRRGGRWLLRSFQGTEARTEEGEVRFHDVAAAVGLQLPPTRDDREESSFLFGRFFLRGIAAGDADGDGDVDLFFPQAGPDAFFRNDGGRFTECAGELGIADADLGAAALFFDYDNDGDLDLLVTNYESGWVHDKATGQPVPNEGHRALALYRNDGARFTDVTVDSGLAARGPATSAAACDVDRDGDLDLYVCLYKDFSRTPLSVNEEIPAKVYAARDGEPDQLWINAGDGTFAEEAARRGVADTGWGLAAGFADYDDDGDPDLYLANDYGENRLFRNRGDGTFEDMSAASGASDTGFGMGVLWFDPDGDGDLDVYASNMYSTAGNRILARSADKLGSEGHRQLLKMARGNTFLRNRGDGTFEDATAEQGVGPAGWAWSSAAYDYDNDGRPDIYVANGFLTSEFATADL